MLLNFTNQLHKKPWNINTTSLIFTDNLLLAVKWNDSTGRILNNEIGKIRIHFLFKRENNTRGIHLSTKCVHRSHASHF